MINATVFPTPPPTAGNAPYPADDPITPDNPVSPHSEPKTAPENEAPLGGSKCNAFTHGCSDSSGKVMTPRDQAEAQRQFDNLCETYDPQTEHEEDLLRIVGRERTLLG